MSLTRSQDGGVVAVGISLQALLGVITDTVAVSIVSAVFAGIVYLVVFEVVRRRPVKRQKNMIELCAEPLSKFAARMEAARKEAERGP